MADNPNPTEDLGYAFVQQIAARGGAIWRRQSEKDLGVDGIIELQRDDGASAYIGVQVKSGPSYFRRVINQSVRIDLGNTLERLVKLNIPAIVIAYNPEEDYGCWENVKDFALRDPGGLSKGYIDIPFRRFDAQALSVLRSDARTVFTPKMAREEVRAFLKLNSTMTFSSFVLLAKASLNQKRVTINMGWTFLRQFIDEGLIEAVPDAMSWRVTAKGQRYVQFLLGGRYYLPECLLDSPVDLVSDDATNLCMFFDDRSA